MKTTPVSSKTAAVGSVNKASYRRSCLAILGCFLINAAWAQTPAVTTPPSADTVVLPQSFPDPLESFNRSMWNFNDWLMTSVVKPGSVGYRFVVPKPGRTGIANAGRNLTYPGRFVNELLQGEWKESGDETARVLCNTVLGIGGLFDVATRWDIPKPSADFGQTFKKWGWHAGTYLMLPILGPSDDRDGTGLVADYAANPLTYFDPFSYISPGVTANDFSDTVDETVRFTQTEADPYSIIQDAWSLTHENRTVDLSLKGTPDEATLQTVQGFFLGSNNPVFLRKAKTRSVLIPATGRKLPFTFWMQPAMAPVVYLSPGFGGHRLDANMLALAELLYGHGYSVVNVSSPFHPEFMENASSTDLPAYPPNCVKEMHVAMTEIDRRLDTMYPHRLGARAIMGYSMGASQSLFLAATEETNQTPLLRFQRYVAIDSPVRLRYAVTNLDQYYLAPLAWPAAERTSDIENTLLKVAALAAQPPGPGTNFPLSGIESKFLIGLSFRLTLRDIIFSSQIRHNQGVVRTPLKKSNRRAAYDEILQFSFYDYIDKFASPYDAAHGIDLNDPEVLSRGTNLKAYAAGLKGNPNIRVILNRNDFLLSEDDLAWLEATFPPAQLTEFPDGGHLGNLSRPEVREAILHALDGLGAAGK